jgi:ABC-2 type transport system ATP-binding protein
MAEARHTDPGAETGAVLDQIRIVTWRHLTAGASPLRFGTQATRTEAPRVAEMLMVEAGGLVRRYGETRALDGLDLEVPAGSILALLGPNGAGKTTAVRILTTLASADAGFARVAGFDVHDEADEVRRRIGVAAQDATVDELLTGRQNLVMIGELSGLSRATARRRAEDLLERFELSDAAGRIIKGYSGGMRRRLDLAASVVTQPPVLFLDEPTTGLDPVSRLRVWEVIRELVSGGATLLLTTQYLDEADQLADHVAVVDHGRVIARGTPHELKRSIGGARLEVTLTAPHHGVSTALRPYVDGAIQVSPDGRRLTAAVRSRAGLATVVVRALDAAGVSVDDIEVRQPSLDDVFFALTGRPPGDGGAEVSAETEAGAERLELPA